MATTPDLTGETPWPDGSRSMPTIPNRPEITARMATPRSTSIARPDGRVTSVELIGRSGSIWLDLALQALFRDAHIPPLPSGTTEPIEFNFTMHYIIRYQ